MGEWWTRDATVCASLVMLACGLVAWMGSPVMGATSAVSTLSASALARWTAPALTRTLARVWCAHRHVPIPPRASRALIRRGFLAVATVGVVNAAVDMWNNTLVTAEVNWGVYVAAVTLGSLALCTYLAWPTVRKYTARERIARQLRGHSGQ